ncbi:MAG: hypothetical protein ACK5XA_08450 [Tagaea sp.]
MDLIGEFTPRHAGERFEVRIEFDPFMGAPWDEHDGHGPVRELGRREDKRPGERPLTDLCDSRSARLVYDVAEAQRIALRDGWGTADGRRPGETARAYAARAVAADFAYCRGWATDEWCWACVIVTDRSGAHESLGGVEYGLPGDYHREVATELAGELIAQRRSDLRCALAAARARHARIRAAWAGWMTPTGSAA